MPTPLNRCLTPASRKQYLDLSQMACDAYQKRHIREAGADLYNCLKEYDYAVCAGKSAHMLACYRDSLSEIAESIQSMMGEVQAQVCEHSVPDHFPESRPRYE